MFDNDNIEPLPPLSQGADGSIVGDDEPQSELPAANPWSPAQFSLRAILVLMVVVAVMSAIVRHTGPTAVFPLIALTIVFWFAIGCVRLIRLPKGPKPPQAGRGELR